MQLWFYIVLISTSTLAHLLAQEACVILKSGLILEGPSQIKEGFFRRQKIRFRDSVDIDVSQIQILKNTEGYFANTSDRLVRRTDNGKRIDLYSDFVTSYTRDFHTGMNWSHTSYVPVYFSKDGGPLKKISAGNLRTALADHRPSIEHLDSYKNLTIVQAALIVGGLAIIASGFQGVSKNNPPKTERFIAGGIVANIALIPQLMKSDLLTRAMTLYNHKERE